MILPHGSDWTAVIDAFFHEQDYAGGERFREHLQRHLGDDLADLLLQQ